MTQYNSPLKARQINSWTNHRCFFVATSEKSARKPWKRPRNSSILYRQTLGSSNSGKWRFSSGSPTKNITILVTVTGPGDNPSQTQKKWSRNTKVDEIIKVKLSNLIRMSLLNITVSSFPHLTHLKQHQLFPPYPKKKSWVKHDPSVQSQSPAGTPKPTSLKWMDVSVISKHFPCKDLLHHHNLLKRFLFRVPAPPWLLLRLGSMASSHAFRESTSFFAKLRTSLLSSRWPVGFVDAIRSSNSQQHPAFSGCFGKTIIVHVVIWFVIQLKQLFKNWCCRFQDDVWCYFDFLRCNRMEYHGIGSMIFWCLLIKPTNKRLHPTYRPLKQKLKLKASSDKHI